MKKRYLLLICLIVTIFVGTTVAGNNIINDVNITVDENILQADNELDNEEILQENEIENSISMENIIDEEEQTKAIENPIIKDGTYRIAASANPFIGLEVEDSWANKLIRGCMQFGIKSNIGVDKNDVPKLDDDVEEVEQD